jgi:ATP adenylyltransferase
VRSERLWRQALQVSDRALRQGALVPLETREISLEGLEPFRLRLLLSRPPRHLNAAGPRPNPFLPWERPLEVQRLDGGHVVILNKYPVQRAHLLLITREWQPQDGWLSSSDWRAVATVSGDTGGLWFFNSNASAGASQPHRHIQLLPRRAGECSCPLAPLLRGQLQGKEASWPWAYRLSRRSEGEVGDLEAIYLRHCRELGLGETGVDGAPRHPYNLLFDDEWFMTVRRVREHCAGFSVNGLGFAGFLLCTERSDRDWLRDRGPWALLRAVAAPAEASKG